MNRHQRRAQHVIVQKQIRKLNKLINKKAAKAAARELTQELTHGSQEEASAEEINPRPEG